MSGLTPLGKVLLTIAVTEDGKPAVKMVMSEDLYGHEATVAAVLYQVANQFVAGQFDQAEDSTLPRNPDLPPNDQPDVYGVHDELGKL